VLATLSPANATTAAAFMDATAAAWWRTPMARLEFDATIVRGKQAHFVAIVGEYTEYVNDPEDGEWGPDVFDIHSATEGSKPFELTEEELDSVWDQAVDVYYDGIDDGTIDDVLIGLQEDFMEQDYHTRPRRASLGDDDV
jgi:hypothetical protein